VFPVFLHACTSLEDTYIIPPDTVSSSRREPESLGKLHKEDAAIFNPALHTGKQLRHFKYATINLLVNLFSHADLSIQVCHRYIQCPPKVWRQSYRNCSVLCCDNIYICIRIMQKKDVNCFLHNVKLYINAQHTCECFVEIYFMPELSEIPETYMFQQN